MFNFTGLSLLLYTYQIFLVLMKLLLNWMFYEEYEMDLCFKRFFFDLFVFDIIHYLHKNNKTNEKLTKGWVA